MSKILIDATQFDLIQFDLFQFGSIDVSGSLVKTKLGLYPVDRLEIDVKNVKLRVGFLVSCFL